MSNATNLAERFPILGILAAICSPHGYNIPVRNRITEWLLQFDLHAFLHEHVVEVFCAMPEVVREELMGDPGFLLHDYDPAHGAAVVPIARLVAGSPSRSVSLKRTLIHRPVDFVRWVIAHELAHAHLRNGGTDGAPDPEIAADMLAANWGFPRPAFGNRW
jgi:hypothetical protein